MPSRRGLLGAAPCLLLPSAVGAAPETYPARAISLVVPYAPGGVTDVVARLVAAPLARELGRPIVVENVTGAGGNIGSLRVAAAAPDGYTLLVTQTSTVTNPMLDRGAGFHPADSFTHVAYVGSLPLWLLVNPSKSPWRSVGELVAATRASPGRLNYGSGGTGSASHLGVAYFEQLERLQVEHVPYRGMSAALTDLLGGSVDFVLTPVAGSESPVQSGSLKALAVTGAHRLDAFPEVPAFAEAGYPAMDVAGWIGISGPRNLPGDVTLRLSAAVGKVLSEPQLWAALQERTLLVDHRAPERFTRYVRGEIERWGQLITTAGIRSE
jgi:tripartite-type tricarboxylate transporter receptor subunit TctC